MFGILFLAVIMISSCSPEMSPKSNQLNIPGSSAGSVGGLSTCYTAHGIAASSQNQSGHDGNSWEFYSNRDINGDGTITGEEFCRYENLHLMGMAGECVFGYDMTETHNNTQSEFETTTIIPCHDGPTMEQLVPVEPGIRSFNAVCCV